MRHYEERLVPQTTLSKVTCDGCGKPNPYLSEVVISVREGEEGGALDVYDYCDACLLVKAPELIAAGSTAPYLTGME